MSKARPDPSTDAPSTPRARAMRTAACHHLDRIGVFRPDIDKPLGRPARPSPAIAMPSIRVKGSPSISIRSAKVPLSPSSALQTMYFWSPGASATVFHLMPVGKPAPPRPAQARRRSPRPRSASGVIASARRRPDKPAMRLVIVQRQRVDHAHPGKGQPGLPLHPGQLLGQPQRLGMRAQDRSNSPGTSASVIGPKPMRPASRLHLDQRLQPDHPARAVAHHRHVTARAARPRPAPPRPPHRPQAPRAAASRGTKIFMPPPRRSAPRPAPRPRGPPAAHRPSPPARRRRGPGRTPAPASPRHPRVVSCQSIPSARLGMVRHAVRAHRLAGLGPAQLQHMPPGGRLAEIVVEADNPMHLGPGQVQRRWRSAAAPSRGTWPKAACTACRIGSSGPSMPSMRAQDLADPRRDLACGIGHAWLTSGWLHTMCAPQR